MRRLPAHGVEHMNWIAADNQDRDWPEGAVIIYVPNPPAVGSGKALSAWRNEDGTFNSHNEANIHATHFFYLPPEPGREE